MADALLLSSEQAMTLNLALDSRSVIVDATTRHSDSLSTVGNRLLMSLTSNFQPLSLQTGMGVGGGADKLMIISKLTASQDPLCRSFSAVEIAAIRDTLLVRNDFDEQKLDQLLLKHSELFANIDQRIRQYKRLPQDLAHEAIRRTKEGFEKWVGI